MIIDSIKNFSKHNIDIDIEKLKYIEGKHKIESKQEIYAIGFTVDSKSEDELQFEAHQEYLDVHFVIEGEEYVYINDVKNMQSLQAYDSENDYELFKGEMRHKVYLNKNNFLILEQQDAHKTGISVSMNSAVKKIVLKIKI